MVVVSTAGARARGTKSAKAAAVSAESGVEGVMAVGAKGLSAGVCVMTGVVGLAAEQRTRQGDEVKGDDEEWGVRDVQSGEEKSCANVNTGLGGDRTTRLTRRT